MSRSSKGWAYWRQVKHIFVQAPWGLGYCLLCSCKKTGEGVVHLRKPDDNDPRRFHGQINKPVEDLETWWKIHGWNDGLGAASCSYGGQHSYEEAMATAREYAKNGDPEGRKYDHYGVEEMVFERCVTVFYHPIEGQS